MSTVFSHIIQKRFSAVNEDVATDALAYILESSAAARRGMQNLLASCASDMPALTFKTQQQEGTIRPDMWGYSGSMPHVYIENKFWAGLTDNQPVAYLKELAKYGHPAVLLVIAPEKRQHTLWRELRARLEAAEIVADENTSSAGVSYLATTSAGPVLALISWSNVLTALELQAVDDPSARGDVAQLRALCDAADDEAFLPISAETISDQRIPSLVMQLGNVVWDAVDMAIGKGVVFVGQLRPQASRERIGKYISFGADRRCGAWIGIHFRFWRKYGVSPIWIVITSTDWGRGPIVRQAIDESLLKANVFTAIDDNGDYVIAVNLPASEEKDHVVRAMYEQLDFMYQRMPLRDEVVEDPDDAIEVSSDE